MDISTILLGISLVVILALVGVIVYLSRRRTDSLTLSELDHESISSDPQGDIHIPAPKLQPELDAPGTDSPLYRRKQKWLSYQEHQFYKLLRKLITDDNLQIFTNARMIDIVYLANYPKNRWKFKNLLLVRHIDFIVCDMPTQKVLLGIELDDSSHQKYDRRESDRFKDSVFQQVGLPLLRFKIPYNEAEVQAVVLETFRATAYYAEAQRQTKKFQRLG